MQGAAAKRSQSCPELTSGAASASAASASSASAAASAGDATEEVAAEVVDGDAAGAPPPSEEGKA